MEFFKQMIVEKESSSLSDVNDTSFTALFSDIELSAHRSTTNKNLRSDHKNLLQELNASQQKLEELKLQEAQLLSQRNQLQSKLQEKKSLGEIEIAKKRLTAMKQLSKLKWITSTPNHVEGFIFNEKNGYVEHFSYQTEDPSIQEKLRRGIKQAVEYSHHSHSIFS